MINLLEEAKYISSHDQLKLEGYSKCYLFEYTMSTNNMTTLYLHFDDFNFFLERDTERIDVLEFAHIIKHFIYILLQFINSQINAVLQLHMK